MLKIISISGLDGSGKSTQIDLLKNYLEAQGKRVFYFHAVKFSIVTRITDFIKKIFYTYRRPTTGVESKSITSANRFSIFLRIIFLKIDILRFKKLCKELEKQGYDYILSDRYFYDSIINIFYLEGLSEAKLLTMKLSFNDYFGLIKPNIAICLEVSPEIIMQRERKPDQGIEYLKAKDWIYSKISSEFNLITVDGNKPKEIIFEEIKKLCQNSIL